MQKGPIHVKTDLFTSNETDTSKETFKRDLYTSKEAYIRQKSPTTETYRLSSRILSVCAEVGALYEKRPTHIKRDQKTSKETYKHQKSPTIETYWPSRRIVLMLRSENYIKRDLCMHKETYEWTERPMYAQSDLWKYVQPVAFGVSFLHSQFTIDDLVC